SAGAARRPAAASVSSAAGKRDESVAAVFLPARFAVFTAHGNFLAVAGRRQTIGGHAQRHEIILRALRPLRAQRQIVLVGAALVAVTFDLDFRRRIFFQPIGGALQSRPRVVGEIVAIEREEDFLERAVLRRGRGLAAAQGIETALRLWVAALRLGVGRRVPLRRRARALRRLVARARRQSARQKQASRNARVIFLRHKAPPDFLDSLNWLIL